MKKFPVLLTLLGGCATGATVQPLNLPDGTAGLIVQCEDDIAVCYKTAGEVCSAGYETMDQRRESTPYSLANIGSGVEVTQTMVIRCNGPRPVSRAF